MSTKMNKERKRVKKMAFSHVLNKSTKKNCIYTSISIIIIMILMFELPVSATNTEDINSTNYKMNILVVYKEGSESYKEVVQDYAQSLCVGTHVKAVRHTEFSSEGLKNYDLIYPDVSLVNADNREEIADELTDYVRDGGNLFLEEDMYKIFPKEALGMSKIEEVNLTNQTFDFPKVPQEYENLQKLWKIYSVKKKENTFYNIIRSLYHKLKGDYNSWVKSPDVYDIDLTKINLKVHATPSTAVSLVNSNGFSLLSVNKYGNGTVLWTINHIPKRGLYFGKPFMTRLDLGYPDPKAKNFHFGYATINYLMRNAYLDFLAKEKYGFSIQKVFGAYGRPSFSWQNHLDLIEVWEYDEMIRWIDILRDENQIPTFSVIRGPHKDWGTYHGTVILNLNVGNNSNPIFMHNGSETPYLLSGTRLQKTDFSYIETGKVAHPFVVDWNEDGKKDLIIGNEEGNVFYYQNNGTNEKPAFFDKKIIKEGGKNLDVGNFASPFVVDWNEDGKKDLIIGNEEGNIYYYQNIGTNDNPAFLNGKIIQEGEKNLDVGDYAAPFIVDWNEDGKKDLIIGNEEGNVFYYQNVGTNQKPAFINKKIIRESETYPRQYTVELLHATPIVVDWNEDRRKDLIIGVSEHCVIYAINSPYLINKVKKNIKYALDHSISIIPHYYVGYNYTTEEELCELEMHKKAFNDLGIPWSKTLGTNHHEWNAHAVPVWQTIYTEKDFGLVYDFGWETMAADFEELYPTTHPYMPYGMPFLLMKNDTVTYPFIIWTPNTLREYITCDGKSGLFVFPSSFDLPITHFIHIEEAFEHTKRDVLSSYLLCFLKYNTIPTRLDLHSGKAYKGINSFNKLREEYEYNMMSEEQAAKAMLNMYYTKVNVKINGSKLTLIPDTSEVPETAEEYKNTLGIKIELHPDFISNGITTDSSIYYKPTSRKIYLGLYEETRVNLNERAEEGFHLVRCNVPFSLNSSQDDYEITVKSAGMRQFKLFSPYPLQVKNKDVVFAKKGKFYIVTDYGDLNKTISLTMSHLNKTYITHTSITKNMCTEES